MELKKNQKRIKNSPSPKTYFRNFRDVNFNLNLKETLFFYFINSIFANYENNCTGIIIRFC